MLFLSMADEAFLRRLFLFLLCLFISLFLSCFSSSSQAGTMILLLACFVPDSAGDFFDEGFAIAAQRLEFTVKSKQRFIFIRFESESIWDHFAPPCFCWLCSFGHLRDLLSPSILSRRIAKEGG
jgi:hypothetical protein